MDLREEEGIVVVEGWSYIYMFLFVAGDLCFVGSLVKIGHNKELKAII